MSNSDSELRELLSLHLSDVPPITDSNREFLTKRLSRLEEEDGVAKIRWDQEEEEAPKPVSSKRRSPSPTQADPQAPKSKKACPNYSFPASPGPSTSAPPSNYATFVFLDLEATGLASAHPRTRITELSLVALSQQELWKYHRHLSEFRSDQVRHGASQDLESVTPRVLNKLTLCFYPGTMVPPQVSHLTGLDNYNLEDQKRFSGQSAAVVRDFLALLQKPICLIAHNGDRYDFPLLRAELSAAGVDRIHLEPGSKDEEDLTFCADSLVALRSVYSEEKKEVSLMPLPRPGTCVFDEDSMECPSSSNTTPTKGGGGASDFNGVGNYPIPVTPPPSGVKNGSALPGSVEDVAPETTPDKSLQATPPFAGGPPPVPRKKPKSQQHPLRKSSNPSSLVSSESAGELKAKKRLDFNVPVSFSLPKLHEHIFGSRPRVSHGAEADCMALLRVCALKYPQVSAWFNTNARQFAKVKPLW